MNGPRVVPTRSSSAGSGAFGLSKIFPPASRCGLGGPAVRSWMHGSWVASKKAPERLKSRGLERFFSPQASLGIVWMEEKWIAEKWNSGLESFDFSALHFSAIQLEGAGA